MNEYKYINKLDDKDKLSMIKKTFGREIEENLITLNNIDLFNVYDDEYYVKNILSEQKQAGFSTCFFFRVKTPIDKGFYLSSVMFNDYNVEVSIEPDIQILTREKVEKIESLEKMYERMLKQELRGLMRKKFEGYDRDCIAHAEYKRQVTSRYEVNKILISEKQKQIKTLQLEIEQLEKENDELENELGREEMGFE